MGLFEESDRILSLRGLICELFVSQELGFRMTSLFMRNTLTRTGLKSCNLIGVSQNNLDIPYSYKTDKYEENLL